MAGPRHGGGGRERREKQEKFQTFNRPKVKATKAAASGTVYVDYKDTETLRKLVSGNGKILTRKRTGVDAMDQRMVAQAVKRARFMALLPYVSASF
jgi:small subunit ribosomal protein S18